MGRYHVLRQGNQTGPYDESEIVRQVSQGDLDPGDLCWREGMPERQPISAVLGVISGTAPLPSAPVAPAKATTQTAPLFLYIPVSRLIILSIVSVGLYEAYWIYKNWRYVKERDGLSITPFWRGIFGVFFCHSLLRRIHEDETARSVQQPAFSPGVLATCWVVLVIGSNLVGRVPGVAASILAAFIPSCLCLMPVQNYINSVTVKRSPGERFYGWSSGHIVCIVVSIVLWTLLLLGVGWET